MAARCRSKTKSGQRCRRPPLPGEEHCSAHLGGPKKGRPSKLTDEVTANLERMLKGGGYVETAVVAAGISADTFQRWIERGDPAGRRRADEPYREFRRRMEVALAAGEQEHVLNIARAGRKDWKASAWLLERQYPARWAGPRGRSATAAFDDPAALGEGEQVVLEATVVDDQVGPDGRPL
jgi:hypothetical protein